MKKCKHIKCVIKEDFICQTEHSIEDGKYAYSYNDTMKGDYTNKIIVYCFICKKTFIYYYKNRPKWLEKYLDQVRE